MDVRHRATQNEILKPIYIKNIYVVCEREDNSSKTRRNKQQKEGRKLFKKILGQKDESEGQVTNSTRT